MSNDLVKYYGNLPTDSLEFQEASLTRSMCATCLKP
jgi:hypothetical protein